MPGRRSRVENDWNAHDRAHRPALLICLLTAILKSSPEQPARHQELNTMSKQQTVTGLVIEVKRHGHTSNGNPTMSVTLSTPTEGFPGTCTFRIQNDASLVYAIENREFRDEPHTFILTRAGRISGLAR